jgi:hypothetical protein
MKIEIKFSLEKWLIFRLSVNQESPNTHSTPRGTNMKSFFYKKSRSQEYKYLKMHIFDLVKILHSSIIVYGYRYQLSNPVPD